MTAPRRSSADGRSSLDSPWLAAAIVAVIVGGGAAILVPGLLDPARPGGPGSSAGAVPTTATTPPAPTFVRPTPSPQPSYTTYLVKPRDTLSSIAKKFDTTVLSISFWNRGVHPSLDPESEAYEPDRLELGWEILLIPGTVVDPNNPPPAPGTLPTAGLGG